MKRHAEIAGGGIGGLSLATMLTRRGWSVRVHEQSETIRELGAGIYIKNNSIEVLESLGLFEQLAPHGIPLERALHVNASGKMMQDRKLAGQSRVHVFPRRALIEVLRSAAVSSGVEIITGSSVAAADPSGEIILADGRRFKADLVVAADGALSKVRASLNLGASHRLLPTLINRYLVPNRDLTPDPVTREHWAGRLRIGITPCSKDATYVYQVCPEWDPRAKAIPNDIAFWSKAFPHLRSAFEALAAAEVTTYNYAIVDCPSWRKGRVAIIGDAAHGLPPTLGQGAGLTMMNAQALAATLDNAPDVESALVEWEKSVRFISDSTQRWAMRYDFFTRQWPTALWFVRPSIVWAFRSIPVFNHHMRIADRGLGQTSVGPLIGKTV